MRVQRRIRIDAVTFAPLHCSDIPIRNGSFSADDGSMQRRFYGAQHHEVGGVFARNGWLGAFGVVTDDLEETSTPQLLT